MISFDLRFGSKCVMILLVGKRPTDWISKMSELDFILEILDNRKEFESFAESAELESLEGFETVPVEFIPYDDEGNTITKAGN